MEAAPPRWRGVLSGILQSGCSIGYLLVALAARLVLPTLGWRCMFWLGALPALLALYFRTKVPESEACAQRRAGSMKELLRVVVLNAKRFGYLVVFMTFMIFLSHGTQDLYPDFLKEIHHVRATRRRHRDCLQRWRSRGGDSIRGAVADGRAAQRHDGRAGLCLLIIPFWSFGRGVPTVVAASVLMQMGAQGAWGVIPVHLNELAAHAVRGPMSGLAYQLGILFASPTNTIEYALRKRFGYQWALAGFEVVTILSLVPCVGAAPRSTRKVSCERKESKWAKHVEAELNPRTVGSGEFQSRRVFRKLAHCRTVRRVVAFCKPAIIFRA